MTRAFSAACVEGEEGFLLACARTAPAQASSIAAINVAISKNLLRSKTSLM
jgi:hypothetical protein